MLQRPGLQQRLEDDRTMQYEEVRQRDNTCSIVMSQMGW